MYVLGKVQVNFALPPAMNAQSGRSRTDLLFLNTEAKEGFVVNATPQPFCPANDPLTIVQGACWITGPHWTAAENLAPHQESIPEPSSLKRVAIPTTLYLIIQRHVSMLSVFRHLHTVNSAANVFAVKLEQERTIVMTPSISAIVLEILISFPWQ